ncbi:MAG: hypothetical protein WCD44_04265 [Candidatus Babeliales bacterium]
MLAKNKIIICILSWFIINSIVAGNGFILFTVLYNETNKQRMQEYISCFERNNIHPLIDEIHVIYDQTRDDDDNKLLQFLKNKGIPITYVTGRPTYNFCFMLANNCYSHKKIILSNADIYFNNTLLLLQDYDLTNKFLALTRWNVQKNGKIELQHASSRRDNIWSQDSWIFQTPLPSFVNDTIKLSTINCDTWVAYYAKNAGFDVINPCLDIQCCHLHLSQIRHLGNMPPPKGSGFGVPWTKLKN